VNNCLVDLSISRSGGVRCVFGILMRCSLLNPNRVRLTHKQFAMGWPFVSD